MSCRLATDCGLFDLLCKSLKHNPAFRLHGLGRFLKPLSWMLPGGNATLALVKPSFR